MMNEIKSDCFGKCHLQYFCRNWDQFSLCLKYFGCGVNFEGFLLKNLSGNSFLVVFRAQLTVGRADHLIEEG